MKIKVISSGNMFNLRQPDIKMHADPSHDHSAREETEGGKERGT